MSGFDGLSLYNRQTEAGQILEKIWPKKSANLEFALA